ncbi:PdaC/SigV domain-containing protein [Paenibacillus sp. PL91]|uniref:PdaC/SigV domain-containing protein n=1 Tax=Paenibacillus sp. PL91 TaxID=2729538 RepID=UPI00145E0155|nr:DUF4163 domain-containing protein [Paenibacillus sp. PL91]MBC9202833.1 DUF4163 domain-containing protein [Paenibacillus sp. PL91]
MRRIKQTGTKQSRANRKAAAIIAALLFASAPATGWLPGGSTAAAASQQLKIVSQPFVIDGIGTSVPTANVEGDTYISLRALNDKLGLATSWDETTRSAVIEGRDRTFTASSVDGSYKLNGQPVYGNPAIINNGTTYLPLRFLLERMGFGISYDGKTRTIGIETIEENELSIGTETISNTTKNQSLLIHYPVITGYANKGSQNRINDLLKKEAEAYAASGEEALSKAAVDNKGIQANIPPLSFTGSYTITYNEQNTLSLYVDYYSYLGGAHGITERASYTFDLATGKELGLEDVTNDSIHYTSIINASIREQIKARKLLLIHPFNGIDSDRSFYLKHDGVAITFGQYEYTSYAEGMPEFIVPFNAF